MGDHAIRYAYLMVIKFLPILIRQLLFAYETMKSIRVIYHTVSRIIMLGVVRYWNCDTHRKQITGCICVLYGMLCNPI